MNRKRTSAVRLSELGDMFAPNPNRKSRIDGSIRSFIPRPSDRVSGVQPLEAGVGSGFHTSHLPPSRHRSADTGRHTQHYSRPRAESAQRPSSQSRPRSTYAMPRETPSQARTPLVRALMQTPNSAAMRQSHPRTPSSERSRGRFPLLERAVLAMPGKDRRVISDINWQKRTNEYVVKYLQSHPKASALMPSVAAPLRPVTIRLFIDLVNCLLGSTNCINLTNYINKLPLTAKRILYPGIMAKSWLKSVNAMHTYPNMLAFLAYMVDFEKLGNTIFENMTIEHMYNVEKHGQTALLRQHYYLQCWDIFQEQAEPDFSTILSEYINALKIHHQVSPEYVEHLQEERAKLLHELNNPVIADAKNREASLKDQPLIIEEQTRRLMRSRSELEREVKQASKYNSQARISLDSGKDHIDHLEKEIAELQRSIEEQGMTVRQKDEIIAETERILTAAYTKKELIDAMQKMGFKKDLELANLQKQALIASSNMNKVLLAVGLAAGVNLNEYTLEGRDLLAGNTLECIRERLIIKLQAIKKDGEERLQSARNNRETGVCREQQIAIQLESERQRLQTLQSEEYNSLEERSMERKRIAAENLSNLRSKAQMARQRTMEKRKRTSIMLSEVAKDLEFWQQQEEKWRLKIDVLRSEENLVRKTCDSRAHLLISQYISLVKSVKN